MDFEKLFLHTDAARQRRDTALAALAVAKETNEHHIEDALKFLFLLDAMYKTDPLVMRIREVISKLNERDHCKYMVVPSGFAFGIDDRSFFGLSTHNNRIVKEKLKSQHILKVDSPERDFIEVGRMTVETIVDRFEVSLAKLAEQIEHSLVLVPVGRRRAVLDSVTDSTIVTVAKASTIWMILRASKRAFKRARTHNVNCASLCLL